MLSKLSGVYPCAKIRIFKQITTGGQQLQVRKRVFILVQRYEFLSKSQQREKEEYNRKGVYPCAKIRIFKQITTSISVLPF